MSFYNCYSLQTISFLAAEEIEENAFMGCHMLSTCYFPNIKKAAN
jgi:hypothetical protein